MSGTSTIKPPRAEIAPPLGTHQEPSPTERLLRATLVAHPIGMDGLVEFVVLASRLGLKCDSLESIHNRITARLTTTKWKLERLAALANRSIVIQSCEILETN